MKKIICALLAVIFSICPIISFASSTSYNADGADLTITLPDSMYVFDRSLSPDDERINALGLTFEGLMSSFTSQDIYLDALDTEAFNEIVVISEPTDDKNFFDLSADELYSAVIAEEGYISQSGRTIEKSDLFEVGDVDFIKTVSKSKDIFVQYTTVYNGKKVKIRLIDFDGNLTNDEAESFEEIVESVSFNTAPQKKSEPIKEATDDPKPVPVTKEPSKEDELINSMWKILLIIAVSIIICTIPALVFRYVFTSGGIKSAGAKAFTLFYTIAMTFLFYFLITKHNELKLSLLLCLVPLLWSFVIYKIVKR